MDGAIRSVEIYLDNDGIVELDVKEGILMERKHEFGINEIEISSGGSKVNLYMK